MLGLRSNTPACLLSSTQPAGISGILVMNGRITSLLPSIRTLALELQGREQALRRLLARRLSSVTSWGAAMPVLRTLILRIFESKPCRCKCQYAHDESCSDQVQRYCNSITSLSMLSYQLLATYVSPFIQSNVLQNTHQSQRTPSQGWSPAFSQHDFMKPSQVVLAHAPYSEHEYLLLHQFCTEPS